MRRKCGEWYDREGSRQVLLSTSVEAAFLPRYLQELVRDTTAVKVGGAAAAAVVMHGLQAFGYVFFAAGLFWICDLLLGIAATLRDPTRKFSLAKLMDGVLKLSVLLIVPPMVAVLEGFPAEAFEIDLGMKPTIAVTGVIAFDFLVSALQNAVYLLPKLEHTVGRIVRWGPGEPPTERRAKVIIVEEEDGEGSHEGPFRRSGDAPYLRDHEQENGK